MPSSKKGLGTKKRLANKGRNANKMVHLKGLEPLTS